MTVDPFAIAKPRDYDSATDYPLLKQIAAAGGEISLTVICKGLRAAGIRFPPDFNTSKSPAALALDRDSLRAWRELGWRCGS